MIQFHEFLFQSVCLCCISYEGYSKYRKLYGLLHFWFSWFLNNL